MIKPRQPSGGGPQAPPIPDPVDMEDGIPDVSKHRSRWKYALIAAAFLAWAAFLLYCGLAGGIGKADVRCAPW